MKRILLLLSTISISHSTHAFGVATEYTQILNHIALVKTVSQLSEELSHQLESIAYLRRQYLSILINLKPLPNTLLYASPIDDEKQRLQWIEEAQHNVHDLSTLYRQESSLLSEELHDISISHWDPQSYDQQELNQHSAFAHLMREQQQEAQQLLEQTHNRTTFLTRLLHTAPTLHGHQETLSLLTKLHEMSLQEALEQKTLLMAQLSRDNTLQATQERQHWAQHTLDHLAQVQEEQRQQRDIPFWSQVEDPSSQLIP